MPDRFPGTMDRNGPQLIPIRMVIPERTKGKVMVQPEVAELDPRACFGVSRQQAHRIIPVFGSKHFQQLGRTGQSLALPPLAEVAKRSLKGERVGIEKKLPMMFVILDLEMLEEERDHTAIGGTSEIQWRKRKMFSIGERLEESIPQRFQSRPFRIDQGSVDVEEEQRFQPGKQAGILFASKSKLTLCSGLLFLRILGRGIGIRAFIVIMRILVLVLGVCGFDLIEIDFLIVRAKFPLLLLLW
jgi:hypothetical protein